MKIDYSNDGEFVAFFLNFQNVNQFIVADDVIQYEIQKKNSNEKNEYVSIRSRIEFQNKITNDDKTKKIS